MLIPTLIASAALAGVGGLTFYTIRRTRSLAYKLQLTDDKARVRDESTCRQLTEEIELEADIRRALSQSVADRFERSAKSQTEMSERLADFLATFEDARQEIAERRAQVDHDKNLIAAHNEKILATTEALKKALAVVNSKGEIPGKRVMYTGEQTNDAGSAVPVEAHYLSHTDVMRSLELAFGSEVARAILKHCFAANIAFHHMQHVAPAEPAIRGSKPLDG